MFTLILENASYQHLFIYIQHRYNYDNKNIRLVVHSPKINAVSGNFSLFAQKQKYTSRRQEEEEEGRVIFST